MQNLSKEEDREFRPLVDSDATVPIDPVAPPPAGDALDIPGYRTLRRIGAGVASDVYLARSAERESVALKLFVPRSRGDRDWLLRGCARVWRISGACVARIYDYGVAGTRVFLAMEHFAGGNLRQRIGPALAPAEALRYLCEAARALEHLHGGDVVHRELKPQNILFRASGEMVLADFGFPRDVDQRLAVLAGEVPGAPRYFSPERIRGEALDHRHDLYSLGAIAYEMLTGGKVPFEGDTATAVMCRHLAAPVPLLPIEMMRFQPVLERLLAKERTDRYQSARELLADLESRFADVMEVSPPQAAA